MSDLNKDTESVQREGTATMPQFWLQIERCILLYLDALEFTLWNLPYEGNDSESQVAR